MMTERDIERACRQFACPNCHAGRGRPCLHKKHAWDGFSHTGRYNLAAEAGLVRPLVVPT